MKSIEERANNYVAVTHSQADNDFQNAMNIAAAKAYIKGAKEQQQIDIERACDILRKTNYFKNDEGISEAAMEEQFKQAMKGE